VTDEPQPVRDPQSEEVRGAYAEWQEMRAGYKAGIKEVLVSGLPLFMGLISLVVPWRQVKAARARYSELAKANAARIDAALDAEALQAPDPADLILAIHEALPPWASLESNEDHWVIVDRDSGGLVCSILDPVELCSDPVGLQGWANALARS
jgi:hypothetical protein